jgi:putative DNA primase/helicase
MSEINGKNIQELEQALLMNPGLKFIAVHGMKTDGTCTCGRLHKDVKEVGKHAVHAGWQNIATSDMSIVRKWLAENPRFNLGIVCKSSGIFAIDVDPRSNGHKSILKLTEAVQGGLIDTVTAITGEYRVDSELLRGTHLLFRCSEDEKFPGNLKRHNMPGIDIKHNGYIVISPSRHFSGVSYEWEANKAPWQFEIAQAPRALVQFLNSDPVATAIAERTSTPKNKNLANWGDLSKASAGYKPLDIFTILEKGFSEGERAVGVYRLACALANKMGTDSTSSQKIENMMVEFNHEKVRPPMELEGPNSLLMHVRRAIQFVRENPVGKLPPSASHEGVEGLTDTNDSSVVSWLSQFAESKFCWNRSRGWLRYDSGVWRSCSDEHFREYLRSLLLGYWKKSGESEFGSSASGALRSLLAANKNKNYESLLRGKLEVLDHEFDKFHELLNVKNGVIDLRDGSLGPHESKNYFTSSSPVEYFPEANHPDWSEALKAVPEYALEYLQVYLGQACSGWVPREDYILIFLGGGRNGKSTLVHLPRIVLGGFATSVSDRILSAREGDHSTELTDLMGRRFAILEEFPGGELNTKRLKDISGTAQISARRMRQDNVSWSPTHTFVMTSNHEPNVAASDDGTWRRLVKMDFPYRFVDGPLLAHERQVQLGLRERLHEGESGQHEAVLAWLVKGAVKWYKNDKALLSVPVEIASATKEWRSGQDVIGSLLTEHLEIKTGSFVTFEDLLGFLKIQGADQNGQMSVKALAGAVRESEFFQSNALKSGRKRTSGLSVSRPFGWDSPLAAQATLISGVVFRVQS